MPHSPSPFASSSSSSSNFQSIVNAALKLYEKQTKKDLLAHPLAAQLQSCNSPGDTLTILKDQVQEFGLSHGGDGTQARWLTSTVNVLYAFSTTLGKGVGLVFSPAKVIFAGFGILLLASITQRPRRHVVHFSHFSVKEFLTSQRLANSIDPDVSRHHVTLGAARTILVRSCLGVLLCLDEHADKESVESFPLVGYAAQHWMDHAQFKNVSSRVRDGMEVLFDSSKPQFAAWLRVHYIDGYWDGLSYSPLVRRPVPLYYAALCGFYDLAVHLIAKHPEQVNAIGGRILNPLLAALHRKHLHIAELLYHHGAIVDIRGLWKRTPLHVASLHGTIDTVRWLLDHGADANSRQDDHWTPLHLTAWKGRLDEAQRRRPRSLTLHMASEFGHRDVLRLLLERGADADARDNERSTPLHLASSNGRAEVVRVLLEHGANLDAEDVGGLTPFQIASFCGREEITRLLTEHSRRVQGEEAA
ncbi:ankyrin repeat-containing domain protein [Lactarius indigo]|nr:ankyrin repeat-containing domain protein [Lactarius indigo]